jgi:predicted transcriptional regulator
MTSHAVLSIGQHAVSSYVSASFSTLREQHKMIENNSHVWKTALKSLVVSQVEKCTSIQIVNFAK